MLFSSLTLLAKDDTILDDNLIYPQLGSALADKREVRCKSVATVIAVIERKLS